MQTKDIYLQAFDRPEYGDFALAIYIRDANGNAAEFAKSIEFAADGPGTVRGPALTMDRKAAQALLESLWRAGLRPKDVGSVGQLQATERHLDDMRTIAFAKLNLKKD